MKDDKQSPSFRLSRRAVMTALLCGAILLCAFFTRVYTAMPWQEDSIAGIPVYQWRQSVAAGFFSAAVWGGCLSAGCVFWLLLAPLTGAHWTHRIRTTWIRLGKAGMIAWIFLFCVVGTMWTSLFPWMAELNRLPSSILWEWGGNSLSQSLHMKGLDALAGRLWFVNMPFFFSREFFYGVLLVLIPFLWAGAFGKSHELLHSHSRNERVTRVCSALLLPIVVVAIGMMGVDWISPNGTEWIPSLFPLAFLANGAVSGLALSCCLMPRASCNPESKLQTTSRMGTLLMTGLLFKLYFWYSIYMLVWYADIPREESFFALRLQGGWGGLASFCAWGNLIVVLLLLVPFVRKRAGMLAGCGALLAFMGALEIYWMMVPVRGADSPFGMFGWVFVCALGVVALSMWLLFVSGKKTECAPVKNQYIPQGSHDE